MAIYPGAMPAGPGLVARPVCFSATTASAADAAITALGTALGTVYGAIGGLFIGLLVSLLTGPEVLTKAAGMAIGVVVGALLGTVAGLAFIRRQISAGTCSCPAGAKAFCLFFYFQMVGGAAIPVPFPPTAAPAACTLVPAGCP